jgi:arylsulfatase A-like enzyme
MPERSMNILLITLDQFRGDCYAAAGHPFVKTPNLDRLAREGVRLSRHYSQAAPCAPGRACLYTGLYQMNNRVIGNGTPLDSRFDNLALAGRRAGYAPTLFGYTDQAVDPRLTDGPDDPRLDNYEGVLPGFEEGCYMAAHDAHVWINWLRAQGYEVPDNYPDALKTEPSRPAEVSVTAYLTDKLIDWIGRQDGPWFAHLSHLRPHPPYTAAGTYASMYDPADMPPPIAPVAADARHPLHERLLTVRGAVAPKDEARMRSVQANYFGMISEVDAQLGRLWEALEAGGQWDDTFIIVTADHGEQMGDHGLMQKAGYFDQSYYILGLIRDPRHPAAHVSVVERFTENVDIFPTLCEAMGVPVSAQCDGLPLTPWLRGEAPPFWRQGAHWEFDWSPALIPQGPHEWPWDRRLLDKGLAVLREEDAAYVHFGDGTWLAFDLAADPTWRTPLTDSARILAMAQSLLTWRAQHLDRTMTGTLIDKGVVGRAPPVLAGI